MKLHAKARTCPHCRSLIVSRVIEDRQPPSKVAGDFRVTSRTVHKWIRRYRAEGAAGLEDRSSAPHSSPRRQLQPGKELHEAVMSLLHTPPGDSGYNRTTWRMSDLKAALLARGTQATQNNIRLVIKRAGFQWRQARVVLTSVDPHYREKVAAIKAILAQLAEDEAVFSIDELGPMAVKARAGKSLQGPGQRRAVPQWQKSRGSFIMTAALELTKNQITHFFSERKNTTETIALIELLRKRYAKLRKLYLCWDAAPWHSSAPLKARIAFLNDWAAHDKAPEIELLPLPSGAQFLNVIESVFSGMARAILHNSDYACLEEAKAAVSRYIEDRNSAFLKDPRRAGRTIWKKERVASRFDETNNCKDPKYSRYS